MRYRLGLVGPPGQQVFVSLILPAEPEAVALVVHGAGSYLGPYLPFAWELADRAVAAALVDLPGHGLSDGTPAHIRSYTTYLEAIHAALAWARESCPTAGSFLVGESYGAILVLLYALGRARPGSPGPPESVRPGGPVRGLVLSAPAFRPAGVSPWALRALAGLARVLPRLRVPGHTGVTVTRNPLADEIVRRDPLLGRRLSAAYLAELVKAGQEATRKVPLLDLPVLFLISGQDEVVDNSASRQAFSSLTVDDRTWQEFPRLAHALLLEDPVGMAAAVSQWIHRTVTRAGRQRPAATRPPV